LRARLGWPLLAKDAIKESLFDALGWSDRAWSKQLSGASYALMFDVACELAGSGTSCMLEGNFRWEETHHRFARLAGVRDVRFVQVFCTADADALLARMRSRIAAKERHPGHVDAATAAELEDELRNRPLRPLPLGGQSLSFDSTRDSVEELVAQVVEHCRG
jgi:predicted kinase